MVIVMSKKIISNQVEFVNGHVYEKKDEENEYLSLWALLLFRHLILHKGSKCNLGKNEACGYL
jgi:hypothetical protein